MEKMGVGLAREPAVIELPAVVPDFRPAEVLRKAFEATRSEVAEIPKKKPSLAVGGLPAALFTKLQPYMKQTPLIKGEYLYQQDDRLDFIYFPENAVISEFQMLADGRTIEVAVSGNESAVGISTIWSSFPAINCAQVCVSGNGYKIESEVLERELAFSRPLQRWLHDQISVYIKQLSQKVICNTHHSVEERFCTWLLMLHDRSKKLKFNLTQEYIAGVLGVYRPSVTCMAKTLRDKRVIDYVRGQILITDKSKLKKMSCACYAALSDG
jgi:CRP-like cAMP-binding protein